MDGWEHVVIRSIPFVVWSFVAATAPQAIGMENRYRRLLTVRLMWGATAVMLFGSLAVVQVIDTKLAVFAYSTYATVAAIVGGSMLVNWWKPEEPRKGSR